MANQPESPTWRPGVEQLETNTPVLGGAGGPSNLPLLQLSERTAWLKQQVDDILITLATLAPRNSPAFTGSPTAPTPAEGDNTTKVATTAWVREVIFGAFTRSVTGGTITLTAAEASHSVLIFTGALTSPAVINVPAGTPGRWTVANRTTGAHTLTVRTAAGAGVAITQGHRQTIICDGTDVLSEATETDNMVMRGNAVAETLAPTTASDRIATTSFARRWARGATVLNVTTGSFFTLTDEQASRPLIYLTGTPAADFTIHFPAEPAIWAVFNGTGRIAYCKTIPQIGAVIITTGRMMMLVSEGSFIDAPDQIVDASLIGSPQASTPSPSAGSTEVVTAEWVRTLLTGQALYNTGDIKATFKTTADTGWIMLHGGTIGNASSGANVRANADTQALFTVFWNSMADAQAPVIGGRGASAAADFAANKQIALPDTRGRAIIGQGQGAGLTLRPMGVWAGTETHVLTIGEMPSHEHSGATGAAGGHWHHVNVDGNGSHGHNAVVHDAGWHTHAASTHPAGDHDHGAPRIPARLIDIDRGTSGGPSLFSLDDEIALPGAPAHQHGVTVDGSGIHSHGISVPVDGFHAHSASTAAEAAHTHTIGAQGGGGSHNNMQPSIAVNFMVKL